MTTCPRCNATGDNPCTTDSGNPARQPHRVRLQVTRSPRALEQGILSAVAEAWWLEATDQPGIDAALLMARKIDDRVWHAEHVAIGSLFPEAPLGTLEGGITFDIQTLNATLTSLGLTSKGRADLKLPARHEASDELAKTIKLHAPVAI